MNQAEVNNMLFEVATSLLDEKGISKELFVDYPDVYDQMKDEIRLKILSLINLAIVDNMPEDKIGEFRSNVIKNDVSGIQNNIKTYIPEYPELITNVIHNFRNLYLGLD